MTQATALQVAQTCDLGVVPHARQRACGTTRKTEQAASPAARQRSGVAKKKGEPKPNFQKIVLGHQIDVTDGYVARWQEQVLVFADEERWQKGWVAEDESGQYEVVRDRFSGSEFRRRVRLLDDDGFPTNPTTGWTETSRWTSSPTVIKFEKGESLPRMIRRASGREKRLRPDECVGDFRLIYHETPKPAQPSIKLYPAADNTGEPTPGYREFIGSRPQATPEVMAALATLSPEPAPVPDTWFRVELPQVCVEHGAWEEYPDGWCAKLAPQKYRPTDDDDKDWTYVQFPYHFYVWYESDDGEVCSRRKTDRAGGKGVECGMLIPRWLLTPITMAEATVIYDVLAEQVAADVAD